MKPYNNPKVFLGNLVKFEYNYDERLYVPYILNCKVPLVFIPTYGYYTELSNVFNNKYSLPLNIIDLDNIKKVKTYKYYITNVQPLCKYTENIDNFLNNLYLNIYKVNQELNLDGKWYRKEDISLDKGLIEYKPVYEDYKIDDELYIANLVSKIKKISLNNDILEKDEYIHVSNNYGLFKYQNGMFKSINNGLEYDEVTSGDLFKCLLGINCDLEYATKPSKDIEPLGLINIYDLHEFITKHHLYLDPNKNILDQINKYNGLKNGFNIRSVDDLKEVNKHLDLSKTKINTLNNEIMKRTLKK